MSRFAVALSTTLLAGAALLTIPGGGAGASDSCVAWASLPARVALSGHAVEVRSTLQGTPACTGVTADAGAHALLNGPGPSTSDYPMLWTHLGDTDSATMYASFTVPGTYTIRGADLKTYDERYFHIPNQWRATSTTVKYAGRFAGVTRTSLTIAATLQFHDRYEWRSHGNVAVALQRRTGGTWQTVARAETSGQGRVVFRAGSGTYRLTSATTGLVWSTARSLGTSRV
ncbi:MAG: hypothetical protein ABR571_02280 [Jatrophihabitans sp.]|uniref:hypothetical protein n=1 Tax=Jatrophihabitans sp. TaxID=1932789 RepID=UPI003913D298